MDVKLFELEKASSLSRQIDALFTQAADLVKQMEVEVRSHDASTRKVLADKVNGYKKQLTTMKTEYNAAKDQADRETLLGGGGGANKSLEQRQRLLDTNDK